MIKRLLILVLLFSAYTVKAQYPIKIWDNAVEKMMLDKYYYVIDTAGDTTLRIHPRYGQLYITANRFPNGITVTNSDVRFGTFSNDANSHFFVSCGASATNSFAYYTGGGTLEVPTATPSGGQFNLSVWRGYDGSSWSNGGFTNVGAETIWTNTTGGHPIFEEFRATSGSSNTAQVRRYWSSLRETQYFNPGTNGRFANGLSSSTTPITRAYFTGNNPDTLLGVYGASGQTGPLQQWGVNFISLASVKPNGDGVFRTAISSDSTASEVQRVSTVSTTNATPTTIATIPLATTGFYTTITVDMVGKSTNDYISGVKRAVVANKSGTLSLIGSSTQDIATTISDAALSTASFTVTTSGTDILIQVTGVAATTINWRAVVKYKIN